MLDGVSKCRRFCRRACHIIHASKFWPPYTRYLLFVSIYEFKWDRSVEWAALWNPIRGEEKPKAVPTRRPWSSTLSAERRQIRRFSCVKRAETVDLGVDRRRGSSVGRGPRSPEGRAGAVAVRGGGGDRSRTNPPAAPAHPRKQPGDRRTLPSLARNYRGLTIDAAAASNSRTILLADVAAAVVVVCRLRRRGR